MSRHDLTFTCRTEIYILESTESQAQVFISLKQAMEEGRARDLEDESSITVTSMNGPVDEYGELRVVNIFHLVDANAPYGEQWKREKVK